jgi:membrane-bound lytic murein transglycosylase B
MRMGRRGLLVGAAALLAGCAPRFPMQGGGGAAALDVNEWATAPDPGYDAWVANFLPRARAAGIPEATLQAWSRRTATKPNSRARFRTTC